MLSFICYSLTQKVSRDSQVEGCCAGGIAGPNLGRQVASSGRKAQRKEIEIESSSKNSAYGLPGFERRITN